MADKWFLSIDDADPEAIAKAGISMEEAVAGIAQYFQVLEEQCPDVIEAIEERMRAIEEHKRKS